MITAEVAGYMKYKVILIICVMYMNCSSDLNRGPKRVWFIDFELLVSSISAPWIL